MTTTYSQFGQLVVHPRRSYPAFLPGRNTRNTGTHIETLADNTPKSRRRVRKICKAPEGRPIDPEWFRLAQDTARRRELRTQ